MTWSLVEALSLLQLMTTAYLCGVIWLVQRVHYPTFEFVAENRFLQFHHFHTQAITPVVGPAMVAEFLLAAILLGLHEVHWFWIFNLGSIALIWAVTFGISVPLHRRLAAEVPALLREKLPGSSDPSDLSVPSHSSDSFCPSTPSDYFVVASSQEMFIRQLLIRRLVMTNWLRTALWTFRLLFLFVGLQLPNVLN